MRKLIMQRLFMVVLVAVFLWGSDVYYKAIFDAGLLDLFVITPVNAAEAQLQAELPTSSPGTRPAGDRSTSTHDVDTKQRGRRHRHPAPAQQRTATGVGSGSGSSEPPVPWTVETWIYAVLSTVFLVLTGWSYLACALTHPGKPPSMFDFATSAEDDTSGSAEGFRFITTSQPCMRCALYKPQRTHHCSTCGECILRYDHHCPWMANCIGYRNAKYFILFLFYTTCYTTVITFAMGKTMLLALLYVWGNDRAHPLSHLANQTARTIKHLPSLHHGSLGWAVLRWDNFTVFWMAFFASTFTLYLLRKAWKRCVANKTTIEIVLHGTDDYQSGYDLGRSKNLQAIFGDKGTSWFRWMLPLRPKWAADTEYPTISDNPTETTTITTTASPNYGSTSASTTATAASPENEALRRWLMGKGAVYECKFVGAKTFDDDTGGL